MGFDLWEFYNELFLKGQKQLLSSIKRRKHHPGSAQPKDSSNDDQPVKVELVQLREHQANSQEKLILLRERLQGMENRQQQLLSFLVIVMQNPTLLSQLLTTKEN